MNVLIIGYGSIGKRHEEVLREIDSISNIDIVSKQNIKDKQVYSSLEKAPLEEYDYFIVSSETFKHFEQLNYINNKVQNKIIFCEKPLFETHQVVSLNNDVYVGYVLRFHPLMQLLKELTTDEIIYFASIESGSYLPNWRKGGDYKKSYSASSKKGGGVVSDLSHELDYIEWLFGKACEVNSMKDKISELDINAEDLAIITLKTERKTLVNIILNYFSKIAVRNILAHSSEKSFNLDLINGTLKVQDKNGEIIRYEKKHLERNAMYRDMHLDVLKEKNYVTSYQEGINIVKLISLIKN